MSDEQKHADEQAQREGHGPSPKGLPRSKVYLDELGQLKELFSEPRIKWAIYLAGFGGLMDGLRVIWDTLKFFVGLTHR